MPQDTGGILNLKKPVGSDDIRLQTIGIDLPYNFQKIDDAFTAHQAESAQKHIAESGSNDNGRYIKFDDGTMICCKLVNTTTYGGAGAFETMLPATFVDKNYRCSIMHTVRDRLHYFMSDKSLSSQTKAHFYVRPFAGGGTEAGTAVNAELVVVGRWK